MKTKLKREYRIVAKRGKSGKLHIVAWNFRTKREAMQWIDQMVSRPHKTKVITKYQIIRRYVSDWELA